MASPRTDIHEVSTETYTLVEAELTIKFAEIPYTNLVYERVGDLKDEKGRKYEDETYQKMLPYLLGVETQAKGRYPLDPSRIIDKKCEDHSPYETLCRAKRTLEVYLSFTEKRLNQKKEAPDFIYNNLKTWHALLSNRMKNDTLDPSQTKLLVEEIYTMLFIAQNPECPANTKAKHHRVDFESDPPKYLCNIQRASALNKKISHWKGWKVFAGVGLMILALALVGVAGAAIALSYGVALPPLVAVAASFNGGALLVSVAYLLTYGVLQHKQLKRENIREEKELATKDGIRREVKKTLCRQYGRDTALVTLFGVVLGFIAPSATPMQSATLSLSKDLSTGVILNKITPLGGNLPASGITVAMLMVVLAGGHAFYQGAKMVKRELYDKWWGDRKLRSSANRLFEAVKNKHEDLLQEGSPSWVVALEPVVEKRLGRGAAQS